ncbi:TPA: plasmid IncI1-type surface exclusion protein ExcA, partial [Escherichia coli]|nr:plasmid IncI1-type surface exclusion protein ExcA [Escherichia coli]HBA9743587.1 plasmid IncI1-type surface exclusion protein ExcA [Escherichia coli]HDH7368318.1 plasmid IncI1-type surface exclusion protein ExcA [Escherichia coli]HEL4361817.1 plasmid IncI1-type surface exclusion protein ExcA [Escherichia coli]
MSTTKSRYPSWWAYYYLVRNTYFIFGIPCLLFYSVIGILFVHDIRNTPPNYYYIIAYGCLSLIIVPLLWLYLRTRAKKKKVQQVVQQIKESSPFAPTSDYEQLSCSKSCYFGIDIKNGTMLYVR